MEQLSAQQIASLLQQQGVSKEKIPTMTAIALAESSGRPKAFNPKGLDRSYGLFQVNMYGGLGPARMKQFGLKTEKDLFEPTTNIKAAKEILGSQGLGAWSVYKTGKYKEFLPQAQQAVQGLTQPQETAARGGTYLIFADEEPQRDPASYLDDYILRNIAAGQTPQIKSGIDPAAMLMAAFNQTPDNLGTT